MCLASVYTESARGDNRELIIDKVSLIEVNDGRLLCHDLFGATAEVAGSIRYVDLANSTVTICLD